MAVAAQSVDLPTVLRHLSIKGFAGADALAEVLFADADAITPVLDEAVATGLAEAAPGDRVRLTADGAAAATEKFAEESARAGPAIEPHMAAFHHIDARCKAVVTSWQVRTVDGEEVPNDHVDADYDRAVVDALGDIDREVAVLLDKLARALPRLGTYRARLARARAAVEAADVSMVAHPFKDSYHTAWFELHEELIRLTGRNRSTM